MNITHRPLHSPVIQQKLYAIYAIKQRIFDEIITMCKGPYFDMVLTKSILCRALLCGLNCIVYTYEEIHVGVSE